MMKLRSEFMTTLAMSMMRSRCFNLARRGIFFVTQSNSFDVLTYFAGLSKPYIRWRMRHRSEPP
jgi:hypothetical protein